LNPSAGDFESFGRFKSQKYSHGDEGVQGLKDDHCISNIWQSLFLNGLLAAKGVGNGGNG
jgi:hypothetical protein